MKTLLLSVALLFCFPALSQNAIVHINAEFNKSNDWYGLKAVEGVKVYSGYLETNKSMQSRYNVTKVPTLILYKDGEEVTRWEAGLDMKLHVTTKEVQHEIDRL